MAHEKQEKSPLPRLVLFMVCLAIAGSIVAGFQYLSGNPGSDGSTPPLNSATGSIQIWSSPGNAYVEIQPADGGMSYGGWTSSTGSYHARDLPAYTSYTVTVSKSGYQSATKTIYVPPNHVSEWHPSLPSDRPDPGAISGQVCPYGGTVCVDGGSCETYDSVDTRGCLALSFRDLDGDEDHVLTIDLPGYAPYSQTVHVPAGEQVELGTIQLQRR